MKSDLDRLLEERRLDAVVVVGADGKSECNPCYRWFVGDAHVTGIVVKPRGREAMLLHADMERDAAAATGLEPVPYSRWPIREIFDSFPTHAEARVELARRAFEDLGVRGRVAVAGVDELGWALAFWRRLAQAIPGFEIAEELDDTVVERARLTKDAREIEGLERVARDACAVVDELRALLAATPVADGRLADDEGPLTIGRLKEFVREQMHRRELSAPDGFILSANRDAGIPHSVGDPEHALRPEDVLLFDFFPRGASGWFHDVTRTWTLGPPAKEAQSALEDVRACFEHVLVRVKPGISTRDLQLETCAFFEDRGHVTIRRDAAATSGYVHSLGHGLGLELHEPPRFPTFKAGRDVKLETGMVVTIEPGLYYPEKGFGVRLEDTVVVTESGARSLSTTSKAPEIPLLAPAGARG